MQTQIKFARMAQIKAADGESVAVARRKALAKAVNFELLKPQLVLDMLPGAAHKFFNGFRASANEPRFAPTADHFKAFMAERFPELVTGADGQKFANASTNPVLNDVSNEFEIYFHSNMPELDLGWTALYDFVDLRNSSHDHFDIITTNAGITWEQIPQGGEIRVRRAIAESKGTCTMMTEGSGLGILDEWIDDQKFWKVDEAIAEFRATYWDMQASVHYGLFTAQSSAIDVAFSTDDTITFNLAAATIIRNVAASGYATGTNPGFYILCAPEKAGRILKLLEATQGSALVAMGSNKEPIAYTVRGVIATRYVASSDTGYYLVLPNRKMKRGVKRDLQIESERDIYHRATDWVGSCRFNAIIGDTAQVRRVKYA